ncbi:hypothetical protein [Halorientalis salina]|jgi:UDP-N-acetylmuramyl pentapeptide phosphotransferase/UDP-N-acetylglucosamine-1-phosphate transferase|uniref:hypothetical protein n=1 Tax=Halorientalis salina TaxID=2932266 RepID=UPI0010AD50E8|nr:hypothetical protein [Halorientalis salina]
MSFDLLKRANGWLILAGFVSTVTVVPWLKTKEHGLAGLGVSLACFALGALGARAKLRDVERKLRRAREPNSAT